jgi:hypothetical protein
VPPLVVTSAASLPRDGLADWAWAYAKAPAALDHLRVVIGDEAYSTGLKSFVAACAARPCEVSDLEREMRAAGGAEATAFFARSVYDDTFPALTVSFERGERQTSVTLSQRTSTPLFVELWLELDDGTRRRERVKLSGSRETFRFETPVAVRAVRPNPRLDPLFWSRSAQAGDVNFDGRVDGLDVLDCAGSVGKRVDATFRPGTESLTGLDLTFDPRCDLLDDGSLEVDDLEALVARFGEETRP